MEQPAPRPLIAVVGSARASPAEAAAAQELGRILIDSGARIICGGLGGVMAAVAQGARESRRWDDGSVIGVIPTNDLSSANPWIGTTIATGMGHARNLIVVASSHAVIAIGGRSGTLSELALAWSLGKPVVVVDTPGGWGPRLAGTSLDDRRTDSISDPCSPAEAAVLAIQLARNPQPPTREF